MGDHESAARILSVMNPVDHAYEKLGENWLVLLVMEKKAHILFYEHDDVRIVIILHYTPKMRMYRIATAGFSGSISPADACFLGMKKLHAFLKEKGQSVAYTIRRRGLMHPLANEFLDAVPLYPGFHVTVEHDMVDRVAWKMHLVESPILEASISRAPRTVTTTGATRVETPESPLLSNLEIPFIQNQSPEKTI
ncbi:MAG: hypothetical protein U1D30_21990 [Planctomycetota bacterium]